MDKAHCLPHGLGSVSAVYKVDQTTPVTPQRKELFEMKFLFANRRFAVAAGLIAIAGSLAPSAFGQLNSSAASVTLNATLAESLTVSATPNNITFTLSPVQAASGSSAITLTTNWTLAPTRTSVVLYGFFASANAALTDGSPTPNNIPSSDVFGVSSSSSLIPTYTPFTQTVSGIGGAGAALELYNQAIASGNFSGERVDYLYININIPFPGYGLNIPAATYTGTLTFVAQAS
jgi:hypothetical protein